MQSGALSQLGDVEILLKEGYSSAAKAYNEGIFEAKSDLLIFVHQDIFLPETWPKDFSRALDILDRKDPNWGVIGCYGVTREKKGWGHIYSTGLQKIVGASFVEPRQVQTLDEIVIIMRKSAGLKFDSNLPNFHLYGADICLTAERAGMVNYAIDAFCIHNSNQLISFPSDFYECYRYIKKKYREKLPIQTSCIRITKFDGQYYRYKASQAIKRLKKGNAGNMRSTDVVKLWQGLREKIKKE
jgi:hypothetical protein